MKRIFNEGGDEIVGIERQNEIMALRKAARKAKRATEKAENKRPRELPKTDPVPVYYEQQMIIRESSPEEISVEGQSENMEIDVLSNKEQSSSNPKEGFPTNIKEELPTCIISLHSENNEEFEKFEELMEIKSEKGPARPTIILNPIFRTLKERSDNDKKYKIDPNLPKIEEGPTIEKLLANVLEYRDEIINKKPDDDTSIACYSGVWLFITIIGTPKSFKTTFIRSMNSAGNVITFNECPSLFEKYLSLKEFDISNKLAIAHKLPLLSKEIGHKAHCEFIISFGDESSYFCQNEKKLMEIPVVREVLIDKVKFIYDFYKKYQSFEGAEEVIRLSEMFLDKYEFPNQNLSCQETTIITKMDEKEHESFP